MSRVPTDQPTFMVLSIPDITVIHCTEVRYEFPEDELLLWWKLQGLHSIAVRSSTHTTVILEHDEGSQNRIARYVECRLKKCGTVEFHTSSRGRQTCPSGAYEQ